MTKEHAILVLYSLSTWLGYERPITEEIVEAIKTLSKPSIPSNLDEAAEEYAQTTFKKPHSDNPDEEVTIVEPDKYAGFIAGAKWDREQMMSKAVECIVEDWNPEPHPEITIPLNPEEFSNGNRVHIIIVKEDVK